MRREDPEKVLVFVKRERFGYLIRYIFAWLLNGSDKQMEKRYFGTIEMATYLGISAKTLYGWVWKKQIPYHKFSRLVKFDIREIDKWTKENKIKTIEA